MEHKFNSAAKKAKGILSLENKSWWTKERLTGKRVRREERTSQNNLFIVRAFLGLLSGRNSEHLRYYKELLFSFISCLSSTTHQPSFVCFNVIFTHKIVNENQFHMFGPSIERTGSGWERKFSLSFMAIVEGVHCYMQPHRTTRQFPEN